MSTKLIELEVPCSRCLRIWIPNRKDTVAGTWRICPKCRVADAQEPEAA